MSRHRCVSLILAAIMAGLLFDATLALAQAPTTPKYRFVQEELLYFDPEEVCETPNQSPICAAKLFTGCFVTGTTHEACLRIGLDIPTKPPRPYADSFPEPWRTYWEAFDEIVPGAEFCTVRPILVRPVPEERFAARPPISPDLVGTVEVIIYYGHCRYGPSSIVVRSLFLKETETGWQAASWNWSMLQQDKVYPLRMDFDLCDEPICQYKANGIAAPAIPLRDNYPPFSFAPVYLPDVIVECAVSPIGHKLCDRPSSPPDPGACTVFSATDPAACEKK